MAHLKPGDVGIHKLGNLTLGHFNESQRRWGELPVFLIQHPHRAHGGLLLDGAEQGGGVELLLKSDRDWGNGEAFSPGGQAVSGCGIDNLHHHLRLESVLLEQAVGQVVGSLRGGSRKEGQPIQEFGRQVLEHIRLVGR